MNSIERPTDLMTPEERLAEIATLLARAYFRAQRKRQKGLALSPGEPLLSSADGQVAAPQEGDA